MPPVAERAAAPAKADASFFDDILGKPAAEPVPSTPASSPETVSEGSYEEELFDFLGGPAEEAKTGAVEAEEAEEPEVEQAEPEPTPPPVGGTLNVKPTAGTPTIEPPAADETVAEPAVEAPEEETPARKNLLRLPRSLMYSFEFEEEEEPIPAEPEEAFDWLTEPDAEAPAAEEPAAAVEEPERSIESEEEEPVAVEPELPLDWFAEPEAEAPETAEPSLAAERVGIGRTIGSRSPRPKASQRTRMSKSWRAKNWLPNSRRLEISESDLSAEEEAVDETADEQLDDDNTEPEEAIVDASAAAAISRLAGVKKKQLGGSWFSSLLGLFRKKDVHRARTKLDPDLAEMPEEDLPLEESPVDEELVDEELVDEELVEEELVEKSWLRKKKLAEEEFVEEDSAEEVDFVGEPDPEAEPAEETVSFEEPEPEDEPAPKKDELDDEAFDDFLKDIK